MLVISNDCVAAYLMNENNQQFNHPFIWTSIQFNELMRLNIEFNDIDFQDIKISKVLNKSGISYQNLYCPCVIISDKINVYYFHHFEDDKQDSFEEEDGNQKKKYVRSKDIDEYVRNLYLKRVKRMQGEPIFIFDDTDYKWYYEELDKTLLDKLKYPLYIYTDRVGFLGNHEKVTYIKKECNKNLIELGAKQLYDKCFKEIMKKNG